MRHYNTWSKETEKKYCENKGHVILSVNICIYVFKNNRSNGNKTQMQRMGSVPILFVNVNIITDKMLQECIPVGCVPSAAVAVGGRSAWGVSARGRMSAQGCVYPGGICPGARGCLPSGCHPTLRIEFLTHACENITFLQLLLRTVKVWRKCRGKR